MKCCPGKDQLPSMGECGDRNDFQLLAIIFYWDFFGLVTLSLCHLPHPAIHRMTSLTSYMSQQGECH